jgi:short subunit dehydrogenase-like uncharacterized protein
MAERTYDVIVWGASGFTGRLVAAYLYQQYGTDKSLRWAVAGRSREKLAEVLQELGCAEVPVLIADSNDLASLRALSGSTRVMCTTVGPYGRYGDLLVEACVSTATHYCDLSGEVSWMRRMIDRHHEAAQAAGVKIVHSCGFDSVPSDMGVFFLQQQALARWGGYAVKISGRVKAAKGGFSGGTYASMKEQLLEATADKNMRRLMGNPYALNPDPAYKGDDRRDLREVVFDKQAKAWIGPFVMAGINTRIVRRSHALAGFPYGPHFCYDEAVITGKGWKGRLSGNLMLLGLGLVASARPGSIGGKLLDRFMPKPGEGPSPKQQEEGYFYLVFYGKSVDGRWLRVDVKGKRDPGYGATSRMLAEAAVSLAKDDHLPQVAGVLTPAIAFGEALIERLERHADIRFSVRE